MCLTDLLLNKELAELTYPIPVGNFNSTQDECFAELESFDNSNPASPASLVKLSTKYKLCGDGDSFCNDILWLIILASIQVGIGGLQVIAAFVACFCVAKSSATKVGPDDEAKDVEEDLKPEVMELVAVENEVKSDDTDASDESDQDNNEDKSDSESDESDVDEKPEEKTEDDDESDILKSEVNYTNKDRRRTTIISIDKEELEDIFKDNTIEEEDGENVDDKSDAGSDDVGSVAEKADEAADTADDNEGLWF